MKKENFVSMIMGTIGGILFALGMCMCMLPAWNAFAPGVVMAIAGAVVLLAIIIVRRKIEGKAIIQWNGKAIGTVLLGIIGALTLGLGMCMIMIWNMFVPGILVGIAGIVLLICLIPICKGIK